MSPCLPLAKVSQWANAQPAEVASLLAPQLGIKPEVLEKIVATIPVKRLGTPEEIGSIVGWLAGDESGFTTGADFSCNGGLHMG